MLFTTEQIEQETIRLFENLQNIGWNLGECRKIAETALKINQLKKEQNAVILAHSYQTSDIMYGVADFIGDSYGLSRLAMQHPAEKIIFASVHFMGETAKLLNPQKQVLVPSVAGCSLAESINAEDVRKLRKKYPEAGVVCYVNTSAAVKAECDVCCTSANAVKIVEAMPQNQIIFLPDEFMGKNIQKQSSKEIILWNGRCIVHEMFTPGEIDLAKKTFPGIKILAHLECEPEVIKRADMAGSTKDMLDFVKKTDAENFMLVTECGITDRVRKENPGKNVVGGCNLCPFMKTITLGGVLKALENPSSDQIVQIPENIFARAKATLDRMFSLEKKLDRR